MKKYKTDYFGFIYLWYNRVSKRLYLGSHFGAYDDGYICSSKVMKLAYKRNPTHFMRRIVYWHPINDSHSLREYESKWLSLIPDNQLNKKFYNKVKITNGGRDFWSEETKRLISEACKRSWTTKRKMLHSQLMRKLWKQSEYLTKQKEERKHRQRNPHSQSTKDKIRNSLKGRKLPKYRCIQNRKNGFQKGNTPWIKGKSWKDLGYDTKIFDSKHQLTTTTLL